MKIMPINYTWFLNDNLNFRPLLLLWNRCSILATSIFKVTGISPVNQKKCVQFCSNKRHMSTSCETALKTKVQKLNKSSNQVSSQFLIFQIYGQNIFYLYPRSSFIILCAFLSLRLHSSCSWIIWITLHRLARTVSTSGRGGMTLLTWFWT